jgi:hypothetical protein
MEETSISSSGSGSGSDSDEKSFSQKDDTEAKSDDGQEAQPAEDLLSPKEKVKLQMQKHLKNALGLNMPPASSSFTQLQERAGSLQASRKPSLATRKDNIFGVLNAAVGQ